MRGPAERLTSLLSAAHWLSQTLYLELRVAVHTSQVLKFVCHPCLDSGAR